MKFIKPQLLQAKTDECKTETRRTHTVEECYSILGISRPTAYKMIREGSIPSIRIGKRILIAKSTIEALLNGNSKNKE